MISIGPPIPILNEYRYYHVNLLAYDFRVYNLNDGVKISNLLKMPENQIYDDFFQDLKECKKSKKI